MTLSFETGSSFSTSFLNFDIVGRSLFTIYLCRAFRILILRHLTAIIKPSPLERVGERTKKPQTPILSTQTRVLSTQTRVLSTQTRVLSTQTRVLSTQTRVL